MTADKYYRLNIENIEPKTLIEEVELLEKLFIWRHCCLRADMEAETLSKHLRKEFLDGCIKAGIIYMYYDTPSLVYLNPGRVEAFKTFLKENS